MATVVIVAYVATAVLVLVHLFSGKLRFLEGTPRSIWLSIAGGVSVAYVFVHLLPELSRAQESLEGVGPRGLENHVYLVALVGLLAFYGLEKVAIQSRAVTRGPEGVGEQDTAGEMPRQVFWLHLGSFGIYNGLVGYLMLHRETPGLTSLIWFGIAMALHFVVADYGLRQEYKHLYHSVGRYVLSAAVVAGLLLGQSTELAKPLVAVLLGFLAGGVVLNVLKEEIPKERQSRFWAFFVGSAGYAALLLLL